MLARIRIAQAQRVPGHSDLSAVIDMLDRLGQAAQADQRVVQQIEILTITALAHAAQGDRRQALVALTAALALAEPEGYIRTFIDAGEPMRALLLAQRAQIPAGELGKRQLAYIDRLLAAFQPAAAAAAAPATRAESTLSVREHSVLQLLADGCSVQEIAARLVISAHTARTHVKHIYAKLNAHNRVQALDRARGLGIGKD